MCLCLAKLAGDARTPTTTPSDHIAIGMTVDMMIALNPMAAGRQAPRPIGCKLRPEHAREWAEHVERIEDNWRQCWDVADYTNAFRDLATLARSRAHAAQSTTEENLR